MSIPPLHLSCAIVCAAALLTTSCSSIKNMSKVTGAAVTNTAGTAGQLAKKSMSKIMPSRMPIASVNTDALKTMPTGSEKARAYQKKVDSKRYAAIQANKAYKARLKYKPLQMPSGMGSMDDGGLLPALTE